MILANTSKQHICLGSCGNGAIIPNLLVLRLTELHPPSTIQWHSQTLSLSLTRETACYCCPLDHHNLLTWVPHHGQATSPAHHSPANLLVALGAMAPPPLLWWPCNPRQGPMLGDNFLGSFGFDTQPYYLTSQPHYLTRKGAERFFSRELYMDSLLT